MALSVVRQPPLPGGELTLLAYHVQGARPPRKRRLAPGHLAVSAGGLRHLWSTGLNGRPGLAAAEQTEEIFKSLSGTLRRVGGTLAGGCVRTWLFMGDIAEAYAGMVAARRELFRRQGLTRATHYISSTGIEGATGGKGCLVGLDAYSVPGLRPGQVSYLNDFSRLCRAADYDVTFERGTRVRYADRSHYFISGTASIDKTGGILYPGDALRQLKRTMGNIGALLRSGGAGLRDLMYLIVYLRNPSDYRRVAGYLGRNFGALPLAVVRGAVCRPGWLVEVEGMAATAAGAAGLPRF
ncbi:MAG: Rid family hydrolase [Elusimicrobiales bacterium]|nr:Rid family hydrolase [Elusimicrobiales bacterium]